MPTERDAQEQDLRIDQMTINIEKMKHDMKMEQRKFLIQCLTAAIALFGLGVAAANVFHWRT
jgi:hypothetical protein